MQKGKERLIINYVILFLCLIFVNRVDGACVNTNYYKSLASASFNSIYKSPTGDDYTVIAATISNICRLMVLNQEGARIMEKDIGDSTTNQVVCNKIFVSDTGKIYVTGTTASLVSLTGSINMLIGEYDKNTLTVGWTKGWGSYSGNEAGTDIKTTKDEGFLYVVGYSNQFTQFSGGNNPVVAKFQTGGTHIWSKTIGGNAAGQFNSLDIPDDGSNIYCAGTTQIWTLTASFDSGVLVKISSAGELQWIRKYSVASTHIRFNQVVVLKDQSYIWTFGNSAGTSGILVKFDDSASQDTLTLTIGSMTDISSATLYLDQSTIFFAGQTSASKMYVGGLRLSDDSLILDKYFDVASSSINDISINSYGEIGIASDVGGNGGIIHFDPDFNDKCTALTITAFSAVFTPNVATVSSAETGQTLHNIHPLIVTAAIADASATTTLVNETCGDMCVPNFPGSTITVGNSLSTSVATFALNTTVAAITYAGLLMDESTPAAWWISVASGGSLTGTSTGGETTYIRVRASYTDGSTYTASSMFRVIVTNTVPTVNAAIPDQTSTVNTLFSFGFSASAFNDVDVGDSLTFSAEQSDGSVLPNWLSFAASTRTFSGTPTSAAVYNIRVKATDLGGSVASDIFTITITNTDPVAATSIADQKLVVGENFEFLIPSGTFTDADGHTISYVSATQTSLAAIPTWMYFIPETGLFTGVPTSSGTTSIRITATDGYGGSDPTSDFNFVVNSKPTVTDYSDLTKDVGDTVSVATPFVDSDGETLTYSAVYQNGSSTITPFSISSTGTLSSTAFTSSNEGKYSVKVTATDPNSNSVSSTQNVIVNSPPTANQSALVQLYAIETEAFSYVLPSGAFISTDTLTYSIDGASTHPAWLSFDADQRKFYGTAVAPPTQANPALTIIATDTIGQTASVVLNISVSTDNAPTLANAIPTQNIKMNASYSITFADTIFADTDGDPIEISFERNAGGSMPDWWSYNPLTRTASGFANTTETSIVVKANGGTAVSTTFTLNIGTNSNPVVATSINSFIAYQDIDFTEDFSSSSFTDPDGDTLTYYLEAVDANNPVPIWVDLKSETRRIYGRPLSSSSGKYQVNVVADDGRGGTTFQTITITVETTYTIPNLLLISILTFIPMIMMFVYFGFMIFIPHESPKFHFDMQYFLRKYDPEYTTRKLKEKEDEAKAADGEEEGDSFIMKKD